MDFLNELDRNGLIVGDGAMGSRLMDRGLPPGTPGELWNLDRPDVVEAIHKEHVEAGAQCLLTNTFGGNALTLARHGLEGRLEEINQAAVRAARSAAGGKAAVLGDIGPTGQLLEPIGTLSREEAEEAFSAQARALASAGVDAIIAETFDSSEELGIALSAARDACDVPLIASMKFQHEKSGRYRSMTGEGPEQLVAAALALGCAVVGTNCGQGIATMVGLVAEIAGLTDLPIIAQPNAGLPKLVKGQTVYLETPSVFAASIPELYRAGARIIGGCCGTTAGHVAAIRSFADQLS
jgi:5-methyltetrahydrofolate--homocysteine methyltransferase